MTTCSLWGNMGGAGRFVWLSHAVKQPTINFSTDQGAKQIGAGIDSQHWIKAGSTASNLSHLWLIH